MESILNLMPKAGVVPFLIMPLRINLTPKFGLSTWILVAATFENISAASRVGKRTHARGERAVMPLSRVCDETHALLMAVSIQREDPRPYMKYLLNCSTITGHQETQAARHTLSCMHAGLLRAAGQRRLGGTQKILLSSSGSESFHKLLIKF